MNHIIILFMCAFITFVENSRSGLDRVALPNGNITENSNGCTCGIFLTGSLEKGSENPPKENATLIYKPRGEVPCTHNGNKLCRRQCLDIVLKRIHNSSEVICGALGRDSYREKAHLFIKNCKDKWINTNLSGPRYYCCKGGHSVKCY